MTESEELINNKLIYQFHQYRRPDLNKAIESLDLDYSDEWSSLMDVVSCIEEFGFTTRSYNDSPSKSYTFRIDGGNPSFSGWHQDSRLLSIYWCVVGFIEYYNLNIKT